jgi:hypothetical protein
MKKEIEGQIEFIKKIGEKPIKWKDKDGKDKEAKLYTTAIKLDDGTWYNMENNNKELLEKKLLDASEQQYKPGDHVTLIIEDKEDKGFWKVLQIKKRVANPITKGRILSYIVKYREVVKKEDQSLDNFLKAFTEALDKL